MKYAEAVAGEAPAAVPVQLFFPSYTLNVLRGKDPASGRDITNLSIISGNGAIQVVVPMDEVSAMRLSAELSSRGNGGGPLS